MDLYMSNALVVGVGLHLVFGPMFGFGVLS